jgi:hypothetical protein
MSTPNPSSDKQPDLDIEHFQTITYSQFQVRSFIIGKTWLHPLSNLSLILAVLSTMPQTLIDRSLLDRR